MPIHSLFPKLSYLPPGKHAESMSHMQASLNRLHQFSVQLTANTLLLYTEAWKEKFVPHKQANAMKQLISEQREIMHRYKCSCGSQQLYLSCYSSHLSSLYPTFLQEEFWILLLLTFQGNCSRCREQANCVFPQRTTVGCVNWLLSLNI